MDHQQSSSSLSETQIKGLDLMPPLVGERICTYLPVGDLLTLRQLSRRTKGWVESPEILSRLCIHLSRSSDMDRMVYLAKKKDKGHGKGVSVLFTNFKISLEHLGLQADIGGDFARIYGPHMKILDISSSEGYEKKISLIMECRMLETLRLKGLSLASLQDPEDLREFGNIIQNLKELSITGLIKADGRQVDQFMGWVLNSRTIRTITIPRAQLDQTYLESLLPIQSRNGAGGLIRRLQDVQIPRDGPPEEVPNEEPIQNEDFQQDPLEAAQALYRYMQMKTLEFLCSHVLLPLTKGLSQGRCPSLKSLDLENIYPGFYKVNNSLLLHEYVQNLMVACNQRGIFIMNFSFLFLKPCAIRARDQFEKSLEAVGSLKNVVFVLKKEGDLKEQRDLLAEGLVDSKFLKNLNALEDSIVFPPLFPNNPPCDFGYPLLLPLSTLTSLTLSYIHNLQNLQGGLCIGERGSPTYPSLNRLDIRVVGPGKHDRSVALSFIDIGIRFPNLRVLSLTRCHQSPEDFQEMFNHLENLEELMLKECNSLDDSVFIWDVKKKGPSPFRGLKNLRKLTIRAYRGGVTNRSLREAFSLLPLNKLSVTFIDSSSISLGGLQGLDQPPFRNSIQYLTLELNEVDIPVRKISTVTNGFKGLKKIEIR